MAVQFVNAPLLTPQTLTANYTSGGTSLSISSALISSAQTGDIWLRIDNEIFKCTAGANSTTLTVAGAQASSTPADHASGAEVRIVVTSQQMEAFDALLMHLAGTETVTGNKTFSGSAVFSSATATDFSGAATKHVDGTTSSPGVQFRSDTDCGLRRSAANTVRAVAGGTDAFSYTNTVVAFLLGFTLSAGEAHGRTAPSSDYTITTNTSPLFIVPAAASLNFDLSAQSGSGTTARTHIIVDSGNYVSGANPLVLRPYDDGLGGGDYINGVGPGTTGNTNLTTAKGIWLVKATGSLNGDWVVAKIGVVGTL